jgi:solute:Na+ symporter, SSS family
MVSSPICIALIALYFAGLILTGIWSGRRKRDSNQYLNATSSLPLWVCAAACIAANCGSLELFAMMALGAQYGMLACHFYWIGAIPALLVVAFWLLPEYMRSRNPTVLDYIGRHYGSATRSLVALCMASMMLLIAGVSLCAVAQTVTAFMGWSFLRASLIAAAVVLFYTWAGGFRATVYTELLHFALVLFAVVPLLFLVARELGGFHLFFARIPPSRLHVWQGVPLFAPHAVMDRFGLIMGLGLVLSFGFWSTDFVQLQRMLAVRNQRDAPFIPLSIATAKYIFAMLVVLTGVASPLVLHKVGLSNNWNLTLPSLMLHYYKSVWLIIGLMGLAASMLSTFSNNVAGFTSAWVQNVYQQRLMPRAGDRHYTWVSRFTNAAAVLLSIGAAYFALHFQSLMEYIQLILSTFNAPLFALVALAAIVPRRAAAGGQIGFLFGLACSVTVQILALVHVIIFGSQMSTNFYAASAGFAAAIAMTLLAGSRGAAAGYEQSSSQISGLRTRHVSAPAVAAGIGLAGLFVVFNAFFW